MAYTSPFKLLPFLDFKSLDLEKINYTQLRRKLLAEFELNDDQPLEVDNKTIGKTEALNVLEQLKDPLVLNQHIEIEKNTSLKVFLSEGGMSFFNQRENFDLPLPEVIQEDFVDQLNVLINELYKVSSYANLGLVMTYPLDNKITVLLDKHPYERFYRRVRSDLAELTEIERISSSREQLTALKRATSIFTIKKAKCINLLPFDFKYLIEGIAIAAINVSSNVYNETKNVKHTLHFCRFVISLDISQEQKNIAINNHKIIGGKGSSKSGSGASIGGIFFIAIVVIKLLLVMGKCS